MGYFYSHAMNDLTLEESLRQHYLLNPHFTFWSDYKSVTAQKLVTAHDMLVQAASEHAASATIDPARGTHEPVRAELVEAFRQAQGARTFRLGNKSCRIKS